MTSMRKYLETNKLVTDGSYDGQKVQKEYYEIAKTFAEAGVSILSFETFEDTADVIPAIQKINNEYKLFIMLQFSVNQLGYTNTGKSASKLLEKAGECKEIDAVGLNCGIGPGHMKQLWKQMGKIEGKYCIALPNAGYPKRTNNRIRFVNNPVYFSQMVNDMAEWGIDIIGGCCGTNPSYIKELSEPERIEKQSESCQRTTIRSKIKVMKDKKIIAVELAPLWMPGMKKY